MPPTGHSKLGASSAKRWLNCPGSVELGADMPNKSSKYAMEGTAAHALAEECLLLKRNPHEYINGGTITVEDDEGEQIEYEVSADMATAVFTYLDYVTKQALSLGMDITKDMVEVGFHLDWIDEELWGTNDLMIGTPFDTLRIYDYKHGKGVAVEVEHNEQLMYYALGAIGPTNEHYYSDVEIIVVQPRAIHSDGPIRTWKISVDDLIEWGDEVLRPGVVRTREHNTPLCSGSHCRWCPAIGVCPEVGKEAVNVSGLTAKQVFDDKPLQFPSPADIKPEQRVKLYEFIEQFEAWSKAVKADTHDKLLSGFDFPGLKVVQGRRPASKWKPGAEIHVKQGLGEDAYVDPKLKSPTQVKKMMKEMKIDADVIEEFIEYGEPGKTIALEGDKRKAINVETAAQAFAEK